MARIPRVLNVDDIIEEVKKHPILYDDLDKKSYGDLTARKMKWYELGAKMFPNWSLYSVNEKQDAVQELQKKWRSLRSSFSRELRQEELHRHIKNSTRKPYHYYDKLLFLLPIFKSKSGEPAPDRADIRKRKASSSETESDDQNDDVREVVETREKITEEAVPPIVKEIDPDVTFALTMVPMLRELPMLKKVDAQIAILDLLKRLAFEKKMEATAKDIRLIN